MDDSILIELECPVCTDYLTLPIRQCATGHSVCGKCIGKLKKCSLCFREFTDARNFTLEGLALKVKYPCVYKDEGCEHRLTYAERENHELHCSKGLKVSCAMEGCSFIGEPRDLKSHWMCKKTVFKDVQKDVVHLINGYYKFDLMEAFDELFWFKRRSVNNKIYFAMQYIGKSETAADFYFELEFCRDDNLRNKFTLSHSCSSIKISDDMLFSDPYYSSIIGFDTISSFVTVRSFDGDQLAYSLQIFRIGEITQPKVKQHRRTNFQGFRCNRGNPKTFQKQNQNYEKRMNQPGQSNQNQSANVKSFLNNQKQRMKNDTGHLIEL